MPDRTTNADPLSPPATSLPGLQANLTVEQSLGSDRPWDGPRPRGRPVLSLLEARFPALPVSLVAAGDSRSKDPSYAAHRWWARRPPSLMRSILLAAVMEGEATDHEFWANYRSEAPLLKGLRVHDPFMGGGTTLIEASRLGAAVSGTDVDPTAEMIVSHSLEPAQDSEVAHVGEALLTFLRENLSILYPDDDGEPLHYFWLAIVECPHCHASGPLYRSLVLARDCGKDGAVLRDDGVTVFDPNTFELHHLNSATRKRFKGARRRWSVDHATFVALKYRCPDCGKRSSHRNLQTGAAPRQLVAVERTPTGRRRKLVAPVTRDLAALNLANELLTPNPPKDTDGRREDSGRGVRELPGRWPGLHWGRWEVGGRSSVAAQGSYGRLRELRCAGWRENTQQGTLADRGGASLRGRWVSCRLAVRPGVEWLAAGPRRE